jgi:hypothetical protein
MEDAREIAERLWTAERELQFAQRALDGSEQARRRYARAIQESEEAQRRALEFIRERSRHSLHTEPVARWGSEGAPV